MNLKNQGVPTNPSEWSDAKREQYLRELDALAEVLLDFYLSRPLNEDPKSRRRDFDILEHQS
jgi:hypothetical protein